MLRRRMPAASVASVAANAARCAKGGDCSAIVIKALHAIGIVGDEQRAVGADRQAERTSELAQLTSSAPNVQRRRARKYAQPMVAMIHHTNGTIGKRDGEERR